MNIIVKLAGMVLLFPAIFCIIQMCNGVFSVWNIFPAALCFIICLNIYIPGFYGKALSFIALKKVGAVETTPQSELDREARELEEDMKKNPEKYKEMEAKKGLMSLDGYYSKLKGWDVLVRFILAAGLAVGAYFSVNYRTTFEQKNVGCSVVEATVMSQVDKTYYTYEEDEDGTTETEHRSCEAVLQYMFDGEVKKQTVTFNGIGKIKVITFDIYVDANGNYLQTTAKIQGFMILGITLAVMAAMVFSSILLKFSPIFYIMLLFFAIGPVILSLVGSTVSFAELLYFDLATFIMVFSCVGVYFMLAQYFGRFLLFGHATITAGEKKPKKKRVNAQQELNNMMSGDGDSHEDIDRDNNY
jgi:hypothetical protein